MCVNGKEPYLQLGLELILGPTDDFVAWEEERRGGKWDCDEFRSEHICVGQLQTSQASSSLLAG